LAKASTGRPAASSVERNAPWSIMSSREWFTGGIDEQSEAAL
jgi:hypothetical protein